MSAEFRSTRDIIIRTPQWAEAVAFYKSIPGFSVMHESASLAGFDTGSFILYVEPGPQHGPVFEFLVEDVAAAKQRLTTAGCAIVEENAAVPRCYLRDPFGLVFNVGHNRPV